MIYAVYTAALAAVTAGYVPVAVWRRVRRGIPLHGRARLGLGGPVPSTGPTGWVHAVSVGEAIAAAPLVEGLRRMYPDLPLVVTTVTETGARVVREQFAASATHRFFPLDLPGAVRRTVDAIRPAFLICMETELWPNTFRTVARRGVPIMIANGRLSDRSFRHYRMIRGLLRPMLGDVRVFAMRSEEDARRMLALGARPERVFVTGNVKHDALPDAPGSVDLWRRLLGLAEGQRVWIAGSTHPGEEAAVLDAHQHARAQFPDLTLVMAPRHPERVPEVLALIGARGWLSLRRSELPRQGSAGGVIVIDTVGELAQLYGVADVVFMGGSLVRAGGHNMLEPALRRKPILLGPHTDNFREAAALLTDSGAARVVRNAAELGDQLARLLANPELRLKLGLAAHEAVAAQHGAVRATLDLVARFLRGGART